MAYLTGGGGFSSSGIPPSLEGAAGQRKALVAHCTRDARTVRFQCLQPCPTPLRPPRPFGRSH